MVECGRRDEQDAWKLVPHCARDSRPITMSLMGKADPGPPTLAESAAESAPWCAAPCGDCCGRRGRLDAFEHPVARAPRRQAIREPRVPSDQRSADRPFDDEAANYRAPPKAHHVGGGIA